jgi:hypothetical protein
MEKYQLQRERQVGSGIFDAANSGSRTTSGYFSPQVFDWSLEHRQPRRHKWGYLGLAL